MPIPHELKERLAQYRYEKILDRESAIEGSGSSIELVKDNDLIREYAQFVLGQFGYRCEEYRPFEKHSPHDCNVTLVAYYLTQYHPNIENDSWWGKGTTEWNNVNQAVPQYVGHYQPRRPGELGYYDLRISDVISRQIELAKNYGIGAFCFYYYWFDGGKRLLEYPLNCYLANKTFNMPFFYCWANENWTKRFSGTNSDVLIEITQDADIYKEFIRSVLPDMLDSRYFRINDRPVLSIYRPSLIPNPNEVISYWKKTAYDYLGVELYLIAVQERDTGVDWSSMGFDAESEFQPKQVQHYCKNLSRSIRPVREDFSGSIYDYADLVANKRYEIPNKNKLTVYPAVMPMWDNTARRNQRGTIFHGSTPAMYHDWLVDAIRNVQNNESLPANLVFINAWNEWGEGAYLEPDQGFGYAYLEATHSALIDALGGCR